MLVAGTDSILWTLWASASVYPLTPTYNEYASQIRSNQLDTLG